MSPPRNRPRRPPAAEYEVGYGRPPADHQFRSGESGNPQGRPKGTKNLKTDLAEELAELVPITENGRRTSVSKQRLMVKALITRAIKGDTRAANILVNLLARTFGLDPPDESESKLAADDAAILEAFLKRAMLAPHGKAIDRGRDVDESR